MATVHGKKGTPKPFIIIGFVVFRDLSGCNEKMAPGYHAGRTQLPSFNINTGTRKLSFYLI
jgi:hypothetical protein